MSVTYAKVQRESEIQARELKKKTDVDEEEAKFMLEYRAKRVQEMQ